MRKLLGGCLVVAVLATIAAGCGGSSRNTAYSGSKDDYVAALDSICANARQKANDIPLTSMSEVAQNGDRAKELVEDTADKVDKLEPPDEVKDSAESFVDGLREEAKEIGDLTDAAKDNDTDHFRVAQEEIASLDAETSEDARFIGSDVCARS
jgi:hypothetical protein